jgi:hypothetical protein
MLGQGRLIEKLNDPRGGDGINVLAIWNYV